MVEVGQEEPASGGQGMILWPPGCGVSLMAVCSTFQVTIQIKKASGGPAGGQTFKKFDKQVSSNHS